MQNIRSSSLSLEKSETRAFITGSGVHRREHSSSSGSYSMGSRVANCRAPVVRKSQFGPNRNSAVEQGNSFDARSDRSQVRLNNSFTPAMDDFFNRDQLKIQNLRNVMGQIPKSLDPNNILKQNNGQPFQGPIRNWGHTQKSSHTQNSVTALRAHISHMGMPSGEGQGQSEENTPIVKSVKDMFKNIFAFRDDSEDQFKDTERNPPQQKTGDASLSNNSTVPSLRNKRVSPRPSQFKHQRPQEDSSNSDSVSSGGHSDTLKLVGDSPLDTLQEMMDQLDPQEVMQVQMLDQIIKVTEKDNQDSSKQSQYIKNFILNEILDERDQQIKGVEDDLKDGQKRQEILTSQIKESTTAVESNHVPQLIEEEQVVIPQFTERPIYEPSASLGDKWLFAINTDPVEEWFKLQPDYEELKSSMDSIPVFGWGSKVVPQCKENSLEVVSLQRHEAPIDVKQRNDYLDYLWVQGGKKSLKNTMAEKQGIDGPLEKSEYQQKINQFTKVDDSTIEMIKKGAFLEKDEKSSKPMLGQMQEPSDLIMMLKYIEMDFGKKVLLKHLEIKKLKSTKFNNILLEQQTWDSFNNYFNDSIEILEKVKNVSAQLIEFAPIDQLKPQVLDILQDMKKLETSQIFGQFVVDGQKVTDLQQLQYLQKEVVGAQDQQSISNLIETIEINKSSHPFDSMFQLVLLETAIQYQIIDIMNDLQSADKLNTEYCVVPYKSDSDLKHQIDICKEQMMATSGVLNSPSLGRSSQRGESKLQMAENKQPDQEQIPWRRSSVKSSLETFKKQEIQYRNEYETEMEKVSQEAPFMLPVAKARELIVFIYFDILQQANDHDWYLKENKEFKSYTKTEIDGMNDQEKEKAISHIRLHKIFDLAKKMDQKIKKEHLSETQLADSLMIIAQRYKEFNDNIITSEENLRTELKQKVSKLSLVEINNVIRLHNRAHKEVVYGEKLFIYLFRLMTLNKISNYDLYKLFMMSIDWPLQVPCEELKL